MLSSSFPAKTQRNPNRNDHTAKRRLLDSPCLEADNASVRFLNHDPHFDDRAPFVELASERAPHTGEFRMAKTIATLLGVVFILVGLLGFAVPGLLGAHLTPPHNVVHLVSGALSLYLGLKGSLSAAKMFCLIFGAVYLLLGVVGFVAGTGEERMLDVAGILHFGTVDHIIHVVLGAIFLIGGLMTRSEYRGSGVN